MVGLPVSSPTVPYPVGAASPAPERLHDADGRWNRSTAGLTDMADPWDDYGHG